MYLSVEKYYIPFYQRLKSSFFFHKRKGFKKKPHICMLKSKEG